MAETQSNSFRDAFRPEIFPVFLMYFLWGIGTGGLWLARPLFAFDTGGTFLLVALLWGVTYMLTDIAYTLIDPRVRLGARGEGDGR